MMQQVTLNGHAYIRGSSRRIPARLEIAKHGGETWLRVLPETEAELSCARLLDIAIDPALGRAARKLTFQDGTVFETTDHAGFAFLDSHTHGARLHRLERFGPHLIGFTLACLAGAFLLWRYGLDILAALAVAMTPAVLVEQIDRGTMQTIDYVMAEPSQLSHEERDRALGIYQAVIAELPEAERSARDFQLLFRHMPEVGPNAFALPGGTMVMTDALLREFPSEDVIAAILGHEIAHVVEEHGLRRLYRSLGAYVLIALLAGDTGPMLEDVLLEGNALLSLSYSRTQETAADEFGLALSHQAGFDPVGLKVFFKALESEMGSGSEWRSSHPSHSARIEAIDAFIETLPAR
ncbi:M48 family metallopeptidase [Planktotalea arctica]|uniref:M48 family metallopeptidase n=1 Tax=Planktotalea arctica TaxID=1481893 RepID=UPI000A1706FF|nr:M48 family metallopeptidase [Planktotalea arctica]